MSDLAQAPTEIFRVLLETQNGAEMFSGAVRTVLNETYGNAVGRYNIDMIAQFAASLDSARYAAAHMADVPRFTDPAELLRFVCRNVGIEGGSVLEFGVFKGGSINRIAALLPTMKIYGFDSFEGLPEAWSGTRTRKGTFSLDGKLPHVRENVELVVGWFDRSLPRFLDRNEIPDIALLHVDCDLYSSTQTILACLHEKIVPGTLIIFDEYFNYPNWQRHEFLAFQEYVNIRQIKYKYIGVVPNRTQVAVRILAK